MSENTNTWTGFKGRVGGWFMASPLRRAADRLFFGDASGGLQTDLALRGAEQVVELGCGSGFFSVPLARRLPTGHIYCVDGSAEMLAHLQRRLDRRGLSDRAELIKADVTSVPLPDESIDRVASGFLLHELPQPELALREAQRLLRPGGGLVVTDFIYKEFMWRRMRHKHHPDAHGPYTLDQIHQALVDVGYEDVSVRRMRMSFIASASKPDVR